MPSPIYIAKRALVTLIKFLAVSYSFRVDLSRDSGDADLRKAYRHLSRKVHPRDFENPHRRYKSSLDFLSPPFQRFVVYFRILILGLDSRIPLTPLES